MSRLHILAGGQCLLHEPVPAGNNAVGVAWRTALVNSGMGGTTSMATGAGPGQITAAELAQVQAGEVLEIAFRVEIPANASAAQRNAIMDGEIAKASSEAQSRIAQALRFFGATRG